MAKKNTGVRKTPKAVTPIMPANTAVPRVRRISAPAPPAMTSGTTPRMNATLVITIGRSRSLHASRVACHTLAPACRRDRAYSTIRMAFLLASPTSTTNPIWVKMFTSYPAHRQPSRADSRQSGTTRMTASGRVQLSYWAASTRNTSTTLSANAHRAVLPVSCCR